MSPDLHARASKSLSACALSPKGLAPVAEAAPAAASCWFRALRFGVAGLTAVFAIAGWYWTSTPSSPALRACGHVHEGVRHVMCTEGRGWCASYAPGTSPEHIAAVEAQLQARFHVGSNNFSSTNRWSMTATGGNMAIGNPVVLTYSFPPDRSTGDPFSDNVLNARFDQIFHSRDAWKTVFRETFAEWTKVTGVVYIEVEDDGAPWPDSPGATGLRGDVRIEMFEVDGVDGILAFNQYPNNGDMALDASENWGDAGQAYRFLKNVVLHEGGHGIGLKHVQPLDESKLMEPFYSAAYFGPQDDDIRGANSLYGDPLEPNNSAPAARDLGVFTNNETFDTLSLHNGSDVDWFRVTSAANAFVAAQVTPLGGQYPVWADEGGTPANIDTTSVDALRIELLAANGTTILGSETAVTPGDSVLSPLVQVPTGQNSFYIRVSAAAGNGVQRYRLKLTTNGAARRVNVTSEPAGVVINTSLADTGGKTALTTPDYFGYPLNQTMTLSAPLITANALFARWVIDGVDQPTDQRQITLTTTGNFNVKAVYVVSLTANAGTDVTIFPGENTQLRPTVTGGTPPFQYRWTPATGLTNPNILAPVAKPVATTTYTLTVTDGIGLVTSDSLLVTVLPPLVADAGADQFVAPGQAFRLSATAGGGTAPYTFTWSPASLLQQASGPIVDGSAQDTSIVTLTVTDAAGRSVTDSVVITVVRPLVVELGADRGAVAGGFVTVDPQISGGRPPYSLVWTPAPTQRDGNRATIYPTVSGKYNVIVTDSQGQQASDSVTVFLIENLAVAAGASASSIGSGDSVTLSASATGGLPPYTFEWAPGAGLDSATSANPIASPTETTTYTVTVRDSGGRTSSATVQVAVESGGQNRVTPGGGCGGASLMMVGGLWLLSRRVGRPRPRQIADQRRG